MSDAPERIWAGSVDGYGQWWERPDIIGRVEYIRADLHAAEIAAIQARTEAAEAALARAYMAGRDDAAKVIKATAHILASTGYEAFSNRINQIADGVLDLPVPADLAKRVGGKP